MAFTTTSVPQAILFISVAGSGKAAIGTKAAGRLSWTFLDADNFYPTANIEKVKQGIRLKDEDRQPWLERLHSEIKERLGRQESVILACSTLKESYRATLSDQLPQSQLDVNPIRDCFQPRVSDFFSKELLDSQLATLEKPKDAIIVDARKSPDEVVN